MRRAPYTSSAAMAAGLNPDDREKGADDDHHE
jgi:hypothetical protein